MEKEKLNEILAKHRAWLNNEDDGERANLRSADLRSADLRYADLRYANLRYANLSSADLRYANLSSADLRDADLRSADLRYANLSSADLRYANLSSADLRYANLSDADLRYADLRSANLRYANLSSADLRYANLSDADLRYANLQNVQSIMRVSVSWTDHGECGRQLLAIKWGDDSRYFCGCFSGSESDLREYIANGPDSLKGSRTVALEFCAARLAEMATARAEKPEQEGEPTNA
ncbi:MAG: pentapeptide repeat-containing protein [Verrucomicrobiota bacterium JB024]|nr:pentapeptide repeat-containing protein [Verrucomicrobiota bacterium JB024]